MSGRISLDDDAAAILSAEELEAIKGDDEAAAVASSSADDADDADAAGDDAAGDDAAAAAAAAPDADAPVEPEAAVEADEPAPFVYRFALPDDYEQQIADVKAERDALFDKVKAGDLTIDEMQVEQARIDSKARELDQMRIQHDIARQSQEHAAHAHRQASINALFARAATSEGGSIDYRKDQSKLNDLDAFVKVLASNEANADKPLKWFLDEAHRRVAALHGASMTPAKQQRQQPKEAQSPSDKVKAATEKRRVSLDDMPPTVAGIPGGQGPGDVGEEFADVLALEGEAYEAAIESMARSAPARFARFQGKMQ